jgi:hypothetical protein
MKRLDVKARVSSNTYFYGGWKKLGLSSWQTLKNSSGADPITV